MRDKIIFVFTMLMIQETFSTIYMIPRENLQNLQSACVKDRIKVGIITQYVGEIGSLIILLLFIPMTEMANKGILPITMMDVFAFFGAFTATIGIIGNILMVINCKERILLQPKPANSFKSLFAILKNKYLLRNFLAEFGVSWWSSDGGYNWHIVVQQEIFGGSIPTLLAYLPFNILDYASVGLIPKIQKMFKGDNRKAVIAMRLWDIVTLTILAVIGCQFVENAWLMVGIFAIFYGLTALNNGPANVIEAELKREMSDYTEYVTGELPDGSVNVLVELIKKVTAPIGAAFTVLLFRWSGYDFTIPMLPWSQGSTVVYQKVFLLCVAVDLIPRIVRLIPYFFYDLVGMKREKMYVELNARRAMIIEENSDFENVLEAVENVDNT